MVSYAEPHRPQIHFSPETGWMNDPNGMVYYDGEYHLFYQYAPKEIDIPNPKHWGHAISTDLVHWEHLPVALSPDSLGEIWSGSAVVDWENSSGLQTGDEAVLVAIFTHFQNGDQQQSLAYSNDRGLTWTKYDGNPVIPNPGFKDYRDPKVFWNPSSAHWVMVLAAGDRVLFYTSLNLIDWHLASQFGELEGAHGGVWECPDLFPLCVDGSPDTTLWVLLVSVGSGAPNGGSGTQYFIGGFDGETFTNHLPARAVNWVDYGLDNYAGVTFSDVPKSDSRRIFIGWMSNWIYAYKVPTNPWRGTMTLPRVLELVTDKTGTPQLTSSPIRLLNKLRLTQTQNIQHEEDTLDGTLMPVGNHPILQEFDGQALEILAEIDPGTATQFGFRFKNKARDQVMVGYDVQAQALFIDRRGSGIVDFDPNFGRHIHAAPLDLESSTLQLHIFMDRSSVEVFGNGGITVITDLIFPNEIMGEVEFYTQNGNAGILKLGAWELESVYNV
jgi:fructan beta-fructosidase